MEMNERTWRQGGKEVKEAGASERRRELGRLIAWALIPSALIACVSMAIDCSSLDGVRYFENSVVDEICKLIARLDSRVDRDRRGGGGVG